MTKPLSYNSQANQIKEVLKGAELSTHSTTHFWRKEGLNICEQKAWGSGATEDDFRKLGGWNLDVMQMAYAKGVPIKGECEWLLWVQVDVGS